ncbi:hypothetical protein AVEN_229497-1 [Araneus ventricosus]|uniref:Uncharacterized protein n=1 Tax=Araneus ventricosus TaxID=182803 RepID=A0A4Y2RRG5_ARAVE|nr:hypothetical protein AVEN_229497-1 [Araneus ventricosus]
MNAVSIPGSEELEVLSPSCIEIVQSESALTPSVEGHIATLGLLATGIVAGSDVHSSDLPPAQRWAVSRRCALKKTRERQAHKDVPGDLSSSGVDLAWKEEVRRC